MAGSQIGVIVAAIAATLRTIAGVQRVYTYEPVVLSPGTIPAVMGSSQAVDYWTVRPETTRPTRLVGYQMEFDHIILFRHSRTAGDVSVTIPVLDGLILTVLNTFSTVFSITPQAEMTGPLEVTWPVLWMVGETFLVHRTEYRLPVTELLSVQ